MHIWPNLPEIKPNPNQIPLFPTRRASETLLSRLTPVFSMLPND